MVTLFSSEFFRIVLVFTFLVVFSGTLLKTDSLVRAFAYAFVTITAIYLTTTMIWIASDILSVIFRN